MLTNLTAMTVNRLASELKQLREVHGYSLRQVEEATGVSNAYLSQLERGAAARPSPHKLAKLADFYKVAYEQLMELAGYLAPFGGSVRMTTPKIVSGAKPHPARASVLRQALLNTDLTPEEEALVAEYISFLKTRNRKVHR